MDAATIQGAAKQIAELELALLWLREHGKDAIMPEVRDTFSINVSLNSCSACRGAKEAAAALGQQARLLGRELVAAAIKDSENTIEILRDRIAREVSR